MTSNATSPAGSSFEGWMSTPNVRGTSDIIWQCTETVVLCAWVSICVNLPSPESGDWGLLRDKFYFVLMTFLGPEIVVLLAYTQYQSARASVNQFKASGYHDWTMVHAFYADMGGISVEPRSWKRFPVTSAQLHYLVTKGYMEYPRISRKEIEARGKADEIARVITIAQTLWFLITTIARAAQGLAITTLELTVVGFIFCTLISSLCWWHKPNDVELGHLFGLTTPMEDILKEAGPVADGSYLDTPLDFISCDAWAGSAIWPFYVNVLRRIGLFQSRHQARPIDRFSSFTFRRPCSRASEMFGLWVGLAYAATFFWAWNAYFPSDTERLLWRVFTAAQCLICAIVGAFEIYYFDSWPVSTGIESNTYPVGQSLDVEEGQKKCLRSLARAFWNKPYNNSISKHPSRDVPLRSLLVTTPLCAAYCVCRWYLLLEDLIGLRSVPSSAYKTVDWAQFLPKF